MPLIPCSCKENETLCRAEAFSGGKPAVELNCKALACTACSGTVNWTRNTRYFSCVHKEHSNHMRKYCIEDEHLGICFSMIKCRQKLLDKDEL